MALIVYGASASPFVRKVRVLLAEKGLAYQHEQVNPFTPPEWFAAISPLKRIPVLRDTGRPEPNTLPDSSVICDYIEHLKPDPAFYPGDPFARARALWYEEYADTQLAQTIGPGLFFERVIKRMMRQQPDEARIEDTLKNKIPVVFDYLEGEVKGRQFLVGEKPSIADISVATSFVNLGHAGEEVDAGRWPELARYVNAILARPSFAACIEEEAVVFRRKKSAA